MDIKNNYHLIVLIKYKNANAMSPVKGLFVESDCGGTVNCLHSITFCQTNSPKPKIFHTQS